MTSESARAIANSKGGGRTPLYAPSWVDRFTDWVDRLPGPSWGYYLGIGVILLLIQAIDLWIEGAFPIGSIDPAHAYLAIAIAYMLGLIHYLDEMAGAALTDLRSSLKVSEEEYEKLRHQLTLLPRVPTHLAGLAGLTCAFLIEIPGEPYHLEALDTFPISANLLRLIYLICWWVFGVFIYHAIRQLSRINLIYTQYTRINLFRIRPLYAFSNLTAFTAGSLAMIAIGWQFANPWIAWTDPAVLVAQLIIQSIAVATFIWPQLGIHRLQVAEKERLLEEANRRFEATIAEIHQRVDDGYIKGMTELSRTISGLEAELRIIKSTPTWPWEPEVVRLLITALALPLGLWVIQLILERILGP